MAPSVAKRVIPSRIEGNPRLAVAGLRHGAEGRRGFRPKVLNTPDSPTKAHNPNRTGHVGRGGLLRVGGRVVGRRGVAIAQRDAGSVAFQFQSHRRFAVVAETMGDGVGEQLLGNQLQAPAVLVRNAQLAGIGDEQADKSGQFRETRADRKVRRMSRHGR